MKIPKNEMIKLGFKQYVMQDDAIVYENISKYVYIEDTNKDGSVDIEILLEAYREAGKVDGREQAKAEIEQTIHNW